ncbi:MAG: peptidase [Acidobacteria bacterium 13_1_40CM_65_14]|nr:MAG: peptidase [Acidobacteria bacterium 13_1_40CM_65_14]
MRRASVAVLFCAIALTMATPRAAGQRFITETDLFKFTWIADPQISPDGSTVAFVRVTVNEKENRYESSLYAVPTAASQSSGVSNDTPRRLTSGIRDTSPRWAPDGKRIAFVRAIEKDGKVQPAQIYLLAMDGGEARPLSELANGAGSPVWSPDGKMLAFSSRTGQEGQDGQERREGQEGKDTPHKSDVKVITRAVYRSNGNPTYVEPEKHGHIFTVSVSDTAGDKPAPKQITDGEFDEGDITWSRDGSTIYFTSTRMPEAYYEADDSDLYSVPAAGGSITKVASIDGSIGGLSLSPDGKRIAFVGTLHGNPVRSYSQPDLWVTDVAPGSTPKNLTASYDFDVSSGIGGDQSAPRGRNATPIVWSKDPSTSSGQAAASLIVVVAEHGSANLKRVTIATGKIDPVTDGKYAVAAYSATPDGSAIAATISTQTNIGDVFVVNSGGARRAALSGPRQITHINDDIFKEIQQSEPEEIWYRTFDGKQVQGWILKPPDFDSTKKYPLILEIHGGPHAAYGNTYTHEFQWMAAKGYVVLFTNPRGSTSYGQDFGNIIQYHYPGDDYKDLMAGVDEVLKKGYVDATRLGVTGGSGGGLLTNWTITQTQRFKAAVAQRDIADWYGFWFTADFTLFQPTWFRKAPWEDPQDFAARSPITHVANVTTPLMLVLGDTDYRTPPGEGGEMMFRALKYRKVPTVMVRFPRETHELSRSGEPWHRVERLQHIVGWMDQWLMGKKNVAYATQ